LDGLGDAHLLDGPLQPVTAIGPGQHVSLQQCLGHLLDVKRVAFSLAGDGSLQSGGRLAPSTSWARTMLCSWSSWRTSTSVAPARSASRAAAPGREVSSSSTDVEDTISAKLASACWET